MGELKVEELNIGMKIQIRPHAVHDYHTKTPKWSRGLYGIIVRLNKSSVTIDVLDGGKPILVDYCDIYEYKNIGDK